jgi:hypothetical protein
MKKIFFIVLIALITMSFLSIEDNQTVLIQSIETIECKYRQCNAIAKSTEKRCKHCVSNSNDYQCYQHKPN